MTYASTKVEVATSNGLGGNTFSRTVMDGRQTNFGTKLIYPFFLKKKVGIKIGFTVKYLASLTWNLCKIDFQFLQLCINLPGFIIGEEYLTFEAPNTTATNIKFMKSSCSVQIKLDIVYI